MGYSFAVILSVYGNGGDYLHIELTLTLRIGTQSRSKTHAHRNYQYHKQGMRNTHTHTHTGADPGGPGVPLDPRFWGPKTEHFWALFNFSIIFFASLRSAYYFFNMLFFQSSNSKIFQPRFARHMISHLEVFVFSLSFTHFRLLGVHLSLSCF